MIGSLSKITMITYSIHSIIKHDNICDFTFIQLTLNVISDYFYNSIQVLGMRSSNGIGSCGFIRQKYRKMQIMKI